MPATSTGSPTSAMGRSRAGLPTEEAAIGVRRLLRTDLRRRPRRRVRLLDGRELPGGKPYQAAGLHLLPRGRQPGGQWPSSDAG